MANGEKATVEMEVPEGMSAEQFKNLTSTFLKQKDLGRKRDIAIQKATKALREKYPSDYKTILNTELKKVGLPVK